MIKTDENSKAQSWELEITCKNKKYLKLNMGSENTSIGGNFGSLSQQK